MEKTIKSGVAAIKILENWGVKNIYGIPGGSINSIMDALYKERESIRYIQVRHEEVGAMAASMHAKFTGHIGVAFGSAGPGGTHMMNGLYDAREDHVPVLAIIGQFATSKMNMDTFQEMNEDPIYADVACYHKVVMTGEQLPHIIDEAIRHAYKEQGVAVVQIPVDLGWVDINEESWYDSSLNFEKLKLAPPKKEQIENAISILNESKRPLIFSGIGMRGSGDQLVQFSKKIKAPIMISALAIDIIDNDYEAFLGSWGRVARKPAMEAVKYADTILLLGTNQPFIDVYGMLDGKRVIQVDIDPSKLGKRQRTEVAILADGKKFIKELYDEMEEVPETHWWRSNIKNNKNWKNYTNKLEYSTDQGLTLYQVYNEINKISKADSIFSVDVGDVTMTSVRHLNLGKGQLWRTSGRFATMGIGLSGAISAKLDFPGRQVFSLSGDGGFSMVMQDLATQVSEKLPIINVVFSNNLYDFIRTEQEETNEGLLGVKLSEISFAKTAEAMGAIGYTVSDYKELSTVFTQANYDIELGHPVLIDAKISNEEPIPVNNLQIDPKMYSQEQITMFREKYQAQELEAFETFLLDETTIEQ